MIYGSAAEWRGAPNKRIMLFGMSGLGKTHVSTLLRETGGWFHYSVDYRIGTRYMGEHIADNFKAEAMKVPFLAALLRSDSIYVASNITFDNLAPLSTYLGKPGDPAKGGLPFAEYLRRQALHAEAEKAAMLDTEPFIARAKLLYGYDHFVCDTSGSIVEVVDPEDPADPVLSSVTQHLLPVWIEGTEAHTEELVRPLRPRSEADVLPARIPPRRMGRVPRADGRGRGPGGPRRLRALDLCAGAGAPPAALCGAGPELGPPTSRRSGRPTTWSS